MKKILFLAAMGALLSACSDDDSCTTGTPTAIQLSPLIKTITSKSDTRTAITGSTAAWANNDALGLYCAQSDPAALNNQFTVSGLPSAPPCGPLQRPSTGSTEQQRISSWPTLPTPRATPTRRP